MKGLRMHSNALAVAAIAIGGGLLVYGKPAAVDTAIVAGIFALIALHLAAIAYYYFAKRENLVLPMLTGDKHGAGFVPSSDDTGVRIRAAILLAIAAALAGYVVTR